MRAVARRARWCAACGLLLFAAGCGSKDDPVVQASVPDPTTSSAPVTTTTSAAPATTSASPSRAPASTAAAPAQGDCGTVPAASGLTLRVLPSPGISCADAKQLVATFQSQLTGKQPAGSTQPASGTVNGWLCVSGPPASEGGTSCSLQDQTVFASVAAE